MDKTMIDTIKEPELESTENETPDTEAYIEAKYIKPKSIIAQTYERMSSTTYKGMEPQLNVDYVPFIYLPDKPKDPQDYYTTRYLLPTSYYKCDLDILIDLEKRGIQIPYEQLIESQKGVLRPSHAIKLLTCDRGIDSRIQNELGLTRVLAEYDAKLDKSNPQQIFNYYKYRTGSGTNEFANAMLIYKIARDPNIPNLRALELIAKEHALPLNLNALTKGVVTLLSAKNMKKLEEGGLIQDQNRGSLYKSAITFSLMVNDRYMQKRSQSSSNFKFLTPYPLSIEETDYPDAEILPYLFFAFEAFLDKSNLPYIIKEGENYPLATLQSQITNLFEFAQKVIKLNGGASNELTNILNAQSVVFNDIFEYYRTNPQILNRINNPIPTDGKVPSVEGFREKLARFGATKGSKR